MWEKWKFSEALVSKERHDYLRTEIAFTQIVEAIRDEMAITDFHVCKADNHQLKGCKRPVFRFGVKPRTFDLFYNSPWGYRGQYCLSVENGSAQNRFLLDSIMERLIRHAQSNTRQSSLSVEAIGASMQKTSAKVWIYETGQINTKDYTLREELLNSIWVTNAREARAALDAKRNPEPEEKVNAILGVRAPEGRLLEVKGAWVGKEGQEQIDKYKKHRSDHIKDYGFS